MGLEKYKVTRNNDGEVVPHDCISQFLKIEMKLVPITYGQTKQLEDITEPPIKWSKHDIANILTNNVVEVDGEKVGDVSPEEVDGFEWFFIREVIDTVLMNSAFGRLYDNEGNLPAPLEAEGVE